MFNDCLADAAADTEAEADADAEGAEKAEFPKSDNLEVVEASPLLTESSNRSALTELSSEVTRNPPTSPATSVSDAVANPVPVTCVPAGLACLTEVATASDAAASPRSTVPGTDIGVTPANINVPLEPEPNSRGVVVLLAAALPFTELTTVEAF